MSEWYLARDGICSGPYSRERLEQIARDRGIKEDDLLWSSESNDWLPAAQVSGIFAAGKEGLDKELVKKTAGSIGASGKKSKPSPSIYLIAGTSGAAVFLLAVAVSIILILPGGAEDEVDLTDKHTAQEVAADLTDKDPVQEAEADLTDKYTAQEVSDMSTDQKMLYAMFGLPDRFVILFGEDEETGQPLRMETWVYQPLNYYYTFRNGLYLGGSKTIVKPGQKDHYTYLPVQFTAGMTPADIKELLGERPEVIENRESGYRIYSFGEGRLVFTFNAEERLVNIRREPVTGEGLKL